MIRMIGFEFEKILNRRIVYAAIAFLVIMCGAICTGRGAGAQMALSAEGGGYLEGREAVAYDKEIAVRYEGVLTEEKVEEILETYAPDAIDARFWMVNNTYDTMSCFYMGNDGSYNGGSVRGAFPDYLDEKPLIWGYNKGWISFLETGMYMMVFVGFLLVIALSPVFSEEYTRGTDALILTSRHGKGKCVWAKIIASYLFTLLTVGICLLFFTVNYLHGFGLDGAGASIQLNTHFVFHGVPYFLTCSGTAGYCLVLWVGGSLILTAFVLLLSALCRSAFTTVIAALACYTVPSMFGQIGIPPQILSLNPIWDFLAEQPVMIPKLSLGGAEFSYVWVVAVFALLMTAAAFVFGKKIFAGHQVM